HVPGLVHVRENRQARGGANLFERAESRFHAGAARRVQAGAIRLVVGRLVDDADAELDRQLGERFTDAHAEVVGFDDAGARDEKRAALPSEPRRHQSVSPANSRDGSARRWSLLYASAAPTKPANSGCGCIGRDFSSGWNWQPMNQGCSGSSIISTSEPSVDNPDARSAYSMIAVWRPRQIPKNGSLCSRDQRIASSMPSMPRTPNPPGTSSPSYPASSSAVVSWSVKRSDAIHWICTPVSFAIPPWTSASCTLL